MHKSISMRCPHWLWPLFQGLEMLRLGMMHQQPMRCPTQILDHDEACKLANDHEVSLARSHSHSVCSVAHAS